MPPHQTSILLVTRLTCYPLHTSIGDTCHARLTIPPLAARVRYVFNRVHNQDAYHTTPANGAPEEHVGMFGARSADDTEAVNAYALAMGLEPRELDVCTTPQPWP